MPLGYRTADIIDAAFRARIDPAQYDRQHLRSAYREGLQLDVGRNPGDFRNCAHDMAQSLPILRGRGTGATRARHDPCMRAEREQPIAQLILKAVHDR